MGTSPAGQTAGTGFAQRMKALACTAPLHDLDARKSNVQTADYTVYQMSELALHTIDLVTVAMDFDTGANPERVIADMVPHVAAQAPERSPHEQERVARWVLENLLNVGSADRGFRAIYGVTGPDGYARRTFDFKLLEETLGPDGEVYLRSTKEAINVLVGALEVDIESAQWAADLRLDILIKNGRLDDAQSVALTNRWYTVQYVEQLRQRLESATRDVRTVDWASTMDTFIEQALTHIEARYRAENAILVNITDVRDTADTADRKHQAAALIDVVRDCLRRNDQLQTGLQTAGRRFRAEQDRQTATPAAAAATLDLYAQLLVPALGQQVGTADRPLDVFFSTAAGLTVPLAPRLADLFDALIKPVTERDLLGAAMDDPDLRDEEEPPRFSEASYANLGTLLDLDPDVPQRLSGLLADARRIEADDPDAGELPLLVVVRVLALAAQEIEAARRHQEPTVMLAVDDGTMLDDPTYFGADLLVTRAAILRQPADQSDATVPAPGTVRRAGPADSARVQSNAEEQREGAA